MEATRTKSRAPTHPDDPPTLTLVNLNGGAAVELFQEALDGVLENILDPNCEPDAKRSVTLKVTLVPSLDRTTCAVGVEVDAKPAPVRGSGGIAYIGRRNGKAVGAVHRQEALPFDDPQAPVGPRIPRNDNQGQPE